MSGSKLSSYEKRLAVPMMLLLLAVLALVVSLIGVVQTAGIAQTRLAQLDASWQQLQESNIEGSEIIAISQLVDRANAPVPAVVSSARWALGLCVVTLLLMMWVLYLSRLENRQKSYQEKILENSEQAAVLRLVDEMSPLASGDLSVKASVGETLTGSLADSFNYTINELRWLVSAVGSSAQHVNGIVSTIQKSVQQVSRSCSEQAHQVHRSSNHLLSMNAIAAGLAADTAESSLESQTMVEQSETGAQVLAASLDILKSIKEEAASTTRLMHRLADNLAAIDDRVLVIQDVAKQTDLLALNTTIRASAGSRSASGSHAAADLGQLSDEVAQLAEVLGQATRDIGSLTRSIAEDASDTVQSMEQTNLELQAGFTQTQQASDLLQFIQNSANMLQERLSVIGEKAVEQTATVRKLTANMDLINKLSQQTSAGVLANTNSVDELKTLGTELQQALSGFRMPDRELAVEEAEPTVSAARRAADRAVIHG